MGIVYYEVIICTIETIIIGGFWKKKYLDKFVKILIITEAIIMGNVVANMHYLQDIYTDVNTGLDNLADQVQLISDINEEDKSFFTAPVAGKESAPIGHTLTHEPHMVHALEDTALRFAKESAPNGHAVTHLPQPTHFSEI